ncbi:MAG: aminotransferase class I/II-fold pyridoxal phosphate-dependent enzyme [Clostridia bacterium]|nr:aminotransferase class I/II-fold pyridoxal phosphate-dependent enzyme [Clostridia bacterium]MBQ4601289.1 aminotransferase class I/II-fold pyridoxal phosphate-dependent enzyme [Clostridia bacterium]
MEYTQLTAAELESTKAALDKEFEELKAKNLKLNMARGVLSNDQLDLTMEMLGNLRDKSDCISEAGTDCRNYGLVDGIPEAKRIFAELLCTTPDNIIVGGNSSLNLMYDTIARNMIFGVEEEGSTPWAAQGKIKFLCPSPGYDRHFAICERMGIEMITVDMLDDGPDMDTVEKLVSEDPSIKGIWCVPKYSNPTGVVYSKETIVRMSALKPAAKDFRVFWDDAYIIHSLYDKAAYQIEILDEVKKYGNDNMVYIFTSTSKISFPGSGIAVIASSKHNIDKIKSHMSVQTIGHDKLNQMRHIKYFGSLDGIIKHMERHAAIIAPKFKLVDEVLTRELEGLGIAKWTKPTGGYFISLDVYPGTAKRVYEMMCELGVNLTPAGATFPYRKDPRDQNLRIAPTFPPLDELRQASEALCLCTKRAAAEKILNS